MCCSDIRADRGSGAQTRLRSGSAGTQHPAAARPARPVFAQLAAPAGRLATQSDRSRTFLQTMPAVSSPPPRPGHRRTARPAGQKARSRTASAASAASSSPAPASCVAGPIHVGPGSIASLAPPQHRRPCRPRQRPAPPSAPPAPRKAALALLPPWPEFALRNPATDRQRGAGGRAQGGERAMGVRGEVDGQG